MQNFFQKIIAFFMSILAFFGLVKYPADPVSPSEPTTQPVPVIVHSWSVSTTEDGTVSEAFCTEPGCSQTKQLAMPLPMREALKKRYACPDEAFQKTDDSAVFYYKTDDFDGYVASMQKLGCQIVQTYSLGSNRYVLMKNEYFTAFVSCFSNEGALRVYIGKSDEAYPVCVKAQNPDVCKPSLWQLSIDNRTAAFNGGMGYILQLSDGSFLVIDGGYETESDADAVYTILSENKPACHEKPVIAGWFITHMHSDHYGAFRRFTQKYADRVQVQAFYCNLPGYNIGDVYAKNCASLEELMKTSYPAKLYRRLHSGMSFSIADALIEVLCTHEDVYPFDLKDANDTSTVFALTVGGQRILFLADAQYSESDRLMYLDDAVLKADIMQYAHHGYDKQCKTNLYQRIAPSVVLWPLSVVNYETELPSDLFSNRYENKAENEWIRNAQCVRKIILADEGNVRLVLPYTPEGDRIVDYKALISELCTQ